MKWSGLAILLAALVFALYEWFKGETPVDIEKELRKILEEGGTLSVAQIRFRMAGVANLSYSDVELGLRRLADRGEIEQVHGGIYRNIRRAERGG